MGKYSKSVGKALTPFMVGYEVSDTLSTIQRAKSEVNNNNRPQYIPYPPVYLQPNQIQTGTFQSISHASSPQGPYHLAPYQPAPIQPSQSNNGNNEMLYGIIAFLVLFIVVLTMKIFFHKEKKEPSRTIQV